MKPIKTTKPATSRSLKVVRPTNPTPIPAPTALTPPLLRLLDILTLRRGHGSVGERKLIEQVLQPYDLTTLTNEQGEPMGYTKVIGDKPKVLYTCHIDTVHLSSEDAKQVVLYDPATELMYKSDGSPLGADDGAGVWLLLEMIRENVPGGYIFFRGEECGGIGSKSLSSNPAHIPWFKTFNYAIAFDRRDTCSVITHQARGRCCSDTFATALANLLSDKQYTLKPDDGGIYTDTAELIELIPECTNVSAGYFSEHSASECLDVAYLLWLREQMLALGDVFDTLPVKRDPSILDADWGAAYYTRYNTGYTTPSKWDHQPDYMTSSHSTKGYNSYGDDPIIDAHTLVEMRWRAIVEWVETAAPEDVADVLYDMAIDLVYNQKTSEK